MPIPAVEVDRRVARFLGACKRAGLRVTHQRLWIFREVARTDEHPDAETIRRRLRRRLPNLSLDTVYRTLRLLEGLGVASPVFSDPDRVRYDANPAPHHHFVCTKCRQVRDFYAATVGQDLIPAEVRAWGQVTSAHLEVRGICARCRAKAARAR
jgi:Fur family peroxide stress response transcriptional regulator